MFCEFKKDEIMEVDLHKMRLWEAWIFLDHFVNNAPTNIKEIIVIHGYHNGTSMLKMVRQSYNNKRVKKKYLSLNNGVTSLIL